MRTYRAPQPKILERRTTKRKSSERSLESFVHAMTGVNKAHKLGLTGDGIVELKVKNNTIKNI
jgi:hypothetical protein